MKMKFLFCAFLSCSLFINQKVEAQELEEPSIEPLEFIEPPVLPPIDFTEPPIPIPSPKNETCFQELSGEKGLFSTKGFPEDYAENSNCTWVITVPDDQKIQLTFHLLNIENHVSCNWDWIKVFESNGTILKHVCGYLQQDLVTTSTNNSLRVQFYSDSVIQAAGFLASWKAIPKEEASLSKDDEKDGNGSPGYVLSFPQSFTLKNSDAPEENICLQLMNLETDGDVEINFYDARKLLLDEPAVSKVIPFTVAESDQLKCFKLQLPADFDEGTAALRVKGTFGNYNILSYKSVRVLKSSTLSLIQTDKFDYRPKQEVKFRVMLLDAELKPSQKVNEIEEVWVTDPANNRLEQWRNTKTKHGMAQFSMTLDEEPSLGTWKVHTKFGENGTQQTEEVSFTVSENVLPKFEVTLDAPDVIYRDTLEQDFKACAKYTHGGNVKGSLDITFSVQYKETYWRSPIKYVKINKTVDELVNGCATVFLNNTEILKLAEKSSDIKINVVAQEEGTGTQQDTIGRTAIKDVPFMLDFGGSTKEHIVAPGAFPYVGRVKAVRHSKEVVANIKLQICTRLFTSLDKMRSYISQNNYKYYNFDEDQLYEMAKHVETIKFKENCNEYETNEEGIVDFSVQLGGQNMSEEITKLNFKITALDYPDNSTTGMKQPAQKFDVRLTHSNSSSALTIHNIQDGSNLICNDINDASDSNKIPVFFSARPGSNIEITHYFTSSGSIVQQDSKTIKVPTTDMAEEYVRQANKIELFDGLETSGTNEIITKYEINLRLPLENGNQGRLSDKINLLVYSRDEDGNILTSSQEFGMAACTEVTAPKVSWSANQVTPSENVDLTLNGNENGYCGYSVVDKSVELVNNPNKVTSPKLQVNISSK